MTRSNIVDALAEIDDLYPARSLRVRGDLKDVAVLSPDEMARRVRLAFKRTQQRA